MSTEPLTSLVMAAFTPEGPLSRWDPHFQPRAGQTEMAQAVGESDRVERLPPLAL